MKESMERDWPTAGALPLQSGNSARAAFRLSSALRVGLATSTSSRLLEYRRISLSGTGAPKAFEVRTEMVFSRAQ